MEVWIKNTFFKEKEGIIVYIPFSFLLHVWIRSTFFEEKEVTIVYIQSVNKVYLPFSLLLQRTPFP